MTKRPESNEDRVRLANGEIPAHLAAGEMTPDEFHATLEGLPDSSRAMRWQIYARRAADALDAKDARIKELEGESEILAFLLGCHEINADQFYWLRKSEISHVIAALSDFMGAEASRKLDDALGRAALKEGE